MMDKRALAALPARLMDRMGIRLPSRAPIRFLIERENWSIKWDGISIVDGVERKHPRTIGISGHPYLHNNKILHFGSQFQWTSWHPYIAQSNRAICTFFHGTHADDAAMARHVDEFIASVPKLAHVITAASLIEQRLLGWGVPRHKLTRIPIGVDTALFHAATPEQRAQARGRYGIRPDQFVIGSFQKDGVGWGEGLEPKLIKGPDILVAVAQKLAKEIPVLVMLTGPARGYVKRALDAANIPYIHEYIDHYPDLPPRYHVLDSYINPSREEGGPKGILESMASGIPVVSTKVGMAPDVITHGMTGMLHDVGDSDRLMQSLLALHQSTALRASLVANANVQIKNYDWSVIANAHYEKIYRPMLEDQ